MYMFELRQREELVAWAKIGFDEILDLFGYVRFANMISQA